MKSSYLILLVLSYFSSCEQKDGVQKSYAFSTVRVPGTIAVDENGRPLRNRLDTITTVFLEIKGEIPVWNYAWKHNRLFTINATQVSEFPFEVGRSKLSNEPIIISPDKENTLWMLSFSPTEDKIPIPEKTGDDEIILQGTRKGQQVIYKVDKPVVELMTHEGL